MHQFTSITRLVAKRLSIIIVALLLTLLSISAFVAPVYADGNGSSVLNAPDALWAGQQMVSPNGQYQLAMQTDGNLVIYGNGAALWASNTFASNAVLAMQSDGNLVIWTNGTPIWASNTGGSGSNNYLVMQNDGNLVIYTSAGNAVWGAGTHSDSLFSSAVLWPGYYLHSLNGQYNAIMQNDGNFVVYNGNTPIWASNQTGSGNYVVMQNDGNLVEYTSSNTPIWASNTAGNGPGSRLTMQNDGNLVLYTGAGNSVWASKSSGGNSSGSGIYNNATIATDGLQYLNQNYGQCWTFARDMIYKASGNTQDISAAAGGGDYFSHLQNAGGTQITDINKLREGDIVQIGEYGTDPNLHTFIIVGQVSGSTFTVVDANHDYKGTVLEYSRTVNLGSDERAFRFGTVQ